MLEPRCSLSSLCVGLRLASGDSEGRVVLWEVSSATAVAVLDDAYQAAVPGARRGEGGKQGGVRDLGWVMCEPAMLAIALGCGLFVLWDTIGALFVALL